MVAGGVNRRVGLTFTLAGKFSPGEGNIEPPFIFDEIYGPWISLWHRERPGPVLKIYRVK